MDSYRHRAFLHGAGDFDGKSRSGLVESRQHFFGHIFLTDVGMHCGILYVSNDSNSSRSGGIN